MPGPWKVLNSGGKAIYGVGTWSLPADGQPGEWMPHVDILVPCRSGYHIITSPVGLLSWLGPEIYEVEVRGETAEKEPEVIVAHEARLLRLVETWTERTARLFACDCAERVVHLCGDDPRPRETIRIARLYADGQATDKELAAARAARDAAWDAARAAARDAAWDAAWATRDAEKEWQSARLMEYLYPEGA
jgi:hypothetical protein